MSTSEHCPPWIRAWDFWALWRLAAPFWPYRFPSADGDGGRFCHQGEVPQESLEPIYSAHNASARSAQPPSSQTASSSRGAAPFCAPEDQEGLKWR